MAVRTSTVWRAVIGHQKAQSSRDGAKQSGGRRSPRRRLVGVQLTLWGAQIRIVGAWAPIKRYKITPLGPGKELRSLVREMNVEVAAVKLALNWDLRYHSFKRRKGQLLTNTAQNYRLKNSKKSSKQAVASRRTRNTGTFPSKRTFIRTNRTMPRITGD